MSYTISYTMYFNVFTFFRSRKSNVVSSTNLYLKMLISKQRNLITFCVLQRNIVYDIVYDIVYYVVYYIVYNVVYFPDII